MTTPLQIGLPQIVLFIIAVLGIGLLISSLMGLMGGRRELELFEDDDGRQYRRWRKRRRRFHWKRGSSGIILLILSISLLWLAFAVQSYLGLTYDVKVATVHAATFENLEHKMNVELKTFDDKGVQTSDKFYLMDGDRWQLEGTFVKFPSWMNIFGIHSSYKLTRLEGTFSDPNLESQSKHTVITLNGGEGDFFKTVYKQAWSSPFIDAAYGSGTFVPADDHTYDVFASQTGFYSKPSGK